MAGDLNKRPIGKCSQCGGVVSVPITFMGTKRPVPQCERCRATADEARDLPVIETKPARTNGPLETDLLD